ncbi:MAG: transporter [Verrucomicrobia bacterium]|nr:transporter [Verrucomicrobiota bacterium]
MPAPAAPAMPEVRLGRAWLVVALLCVVACLNYLDRVMLTTMRGSIQQAIPMTDAQFGLLTSAFLWVYAGLSPFAGFLADRFGRARMIIVSLFVWSSITWLTAHAQTYEQLLVARALLGVSEACYIPAALALISDYHRGATRSMATGLHMIAVSIGAGLGGLGGVIAERGKWNTPFVLFGAIGVGYSLLLILLLRDAPRAALAGAGEKVKLGESLRSLFSHGSFILAMVYWGLLGIAGWAVIGWLPTYFGDHFKLSQGEAGMSATGYLQPAAWVGILLGAWLADRWSKVHPRGRIFAVAISLTLAVPCILVGSHTNVFAIALIGFMLHSAAYNFSDSNMMPILCLVTDARYRATGYGLLNLFGCVMGGVTIYIGGMLRDAHADLAHIFEGAAAGMAICAILLLCMKPRPVPANGPE